MATTAFDSQHATWEGEPSWKSCEAPDGGPRTHYTVDYAYAACGPQIFILCVSGIKNRLSTKHIAGTAIG